MRTASGWLALVCERLAAREYACAAEVAAAAVPDHPLDGRFWELGGVACWMDGQAQAAVPCLEEATTLKPLHPFAQVALADGYHRLGKRGLARTVWEFLAGPVGGHRLVGLLEGRPGTVPDWHLAYTAYRTAADHDPRNHHAWFGLGISLARLGGDRARTAECLAVAVRQAPGVVPYRLGLADAWISAGEHGRAAEVMSWFDPHRVSCRCLLGWAASVFERLGAADRLEECRLRLAGLDRQCVNERGSDS